MTINTITKENIKITLFPDNQPHVDLPDTIQPNTEVKVITRLATANDVMHLLQISDALDTIGAVKDSLEIAYLMAARYDRNMRYGDSFDLRVIAKLINSCNFERVFLQDVHSKVATNLIERSANRTNYYLVTQYKRPDAVLIVPDNGALGKALDYGKWNRNIVAVVRCDKSRDLDTGRVTLTVRNPEKCEGRNCIIIDDICDGGATFLAIAEQIKPAHLTLMVTHGIFSKGFGKLAEAFDEIITTDTYPQTGGRPSNLRIINIYE